MNSRLKSIHLILIIVGLSLAQAVNAASTNYPVRGVLKTIKLDEQQLVIAHEEIPGFMDAMTMPFRVKDATLLTNAVVGAKISFQLHVTETESWIDNIKTLTPPDSPARDSATLTNTTSTAQIALKPTPSIQPKSPLRDYKFTNELGQPVSLSDFKGQALALTFIFTRCPIPEYCPRLSRNFQEAQQQLKQMPNAPTNWHLLTVTFDPERDTPTVLKAYGETHQYDPAHWSFLTGPKDKIAELARLCDVNFDFENGTFNHNFRTLIINASNQLQMVFPTSGDLSAAIAAELLKAMHGTNQTAAPTKSNSRPNSNP